MYERNILRKFLSVLLIFTLLVGYAPAQAAGKTKAKATKTLTTTQASPLYKSAKTGSKKLIKSVKSGTEVTLISSKGNWKKVKLKGKTGYMKESAFAPVKAAPTKAPAKPTPTKAPAKKSAGEDMLTTRKAKMYQKMSTKAKAVSVAEGKSVKVISQSGRWRKVKVSGKGGYMLAESFVATALGNTRMHEKPGSGAKYVAVKAGESVTVLGKDGDWYKVKRGSKRGYMKAQTLSFPNGEAAQATPVPKPTEAPKPTEEPSADEKAAKTRRTTQKVYMYQKPSTSAKHVTVKAGTTLTILKDDGKWIKVKHGSKQGYVREKAFAAVPAAPSATPKPTEAPGAGSSYRTLRSGNKGASVLQLQQRLEALGYLDIVPSSRYAATTVSAVKQFQKQAKIKANGVANNKTQQALYAPGAPASPIRAASLKKGSKGTLVKRLQLRLRAKGFHKGKINSKFDDATESSVKSYQAQAGLKADGVAGRGTLASLFSSGAPSYSDQPAATPAPTSTVKPTATPAPTKAPTVTPAPTKAPAPVPPASAGKKKKADQVIAAAMAKLGKPYVFGATGPNSYDCSGFTMYAYSVVGVKLPHSAYMQGYSCGTKVAESQLQRGDLVCWNTISDGDLSDHVGIYLGNGQAIHASSGTRKVIISSISSGYYKNVLSWGRDLL